MTDWFTVRPCANGCLTTDGNVAVASHGAFCARCHDLARLALTNVGPLVGHLVGQISGLMSKPGNSGAQRTKADSAPLPFNMRAFDDANTVYRMLVGWSVRMASKIGQPVPAPAAGAWRNGAAKVVGLPNGVTMLQARTEVSRMARWHIDRLDLIMDLSDTDTVSHYLLDIARLQRINLMWPVEDRPAFSRRAACPDDAGRLLIVPPREQGADRGIVCSVCGRHFTEDEHERIAAYVVAMARQRRLTEKTTPEVAAEVIRSSPPTEPIPVVV